MKVCVIATRPASFSVLCESNQPKLEQFSDEFLNSIRHQNTRKRYASSVASLRTHFGDARLTEINAERIDEFKDSRLASKVRAATVNRDLAVLRRMLRIAERKRLITSTPFREVEMLEERKERRQRPHILTFEEEKKLLAVAPDYVRILAILILDSGLRSGREALALKWKDVDFADDAILIRESKTFAGIRSVPMSSRCKAELLRWREGLGPEFSEYVFENPQQPKTHLKDIRKAWPSALQAAGLEYFWVYDLRHTFASRLTAAGVSRRRNGPQHQRMGHLQRCGVWLQVIVAWGSLLGVSESAWLLSSAFVHQALLLRLIHSNLPGKWNYFRVARDPPGIGIRQPSFDFRRHSFGEVIQIYMLS